MRLRPELRKLEDALKMREVPEYLKHDNRDQDDILTEHSDKTVHLTIALAIALWEANGQALTDPMKEFQKLPNPYRPGYRHSTVFNVVRDQGIPSAKDIATSPSTVSGASPIMRAPRPNRNKKDE